MKTAPIFSSEPILEAKDISFGFLDKINVIQDIQIKIHKNERIAIIGPNGSGKTTLLRALAGRFAKLQDRLLLKQSPFSSLSRRELAQSIAFVAQNDSVDARLRVQDYVSLGQIPHLHTLSKKEQRIQIEQAMIDTEMTPLATRALGTLSGGQKQRALLARAFAQNPEVLMLDEPTNHLDPRSRNDILALVRNCQRTVIAVLHDLPLVPDFADRVLVMNKGRIIADGSVMETLTEELLNEVFGMSRFIVEHPKTGKAFMVFEPLHDEKVG